MLGKNMDDCGIALPCRNNTSSLKGATIPTSEADESICLSDLDRISIVRRNTTIVWLRNACTPFIVWKHAWLVCLGTRWYFLTNVEIGSRRSYCCPTFRVNHTQSWWTIETCDLLWFIRTEAHLCGFPFMLLVLFPHLCLKNPLLLVLVWHICLGNPLWPTA